jgi:hypothetical protein
VRNLVVGLSLILLSLLTVNVASVRGETPKLVGSASASDELSVVWTTYPAPFAIAEGSGMVVVNVQGDVIGGPYIYYFNTMHVSLVLQADWVQSDGTTYSLKAKVTVPLSMASRGTVSGDAHPDGTFIICGAFFGCSVPFDGFLTVNNVRTGLEGTAEIWALTPQTSFQAATSNYLVVQLDSGPYSFSIGWSEAAQTVGGVPLPQADQYFQSVQIIA